MESILRVPGRAVLQFITYLGQLGLLGRDVVESFVRGKMYLKRVAAQIVAIGYGSQLVIVVTGAFTGAVFAAQCFFKFKEYGVESTVGALVSIAMCRELAPVLTGLMVAGRVGAAMAAEIGTMKVTEQVDALRAMAVHPIDFLVKPRVIAIMISMPLLIAESITFGMVAAYVITVHGFGINAAWYMEHVQLHTELEDIVIGMIKGFFFGIIIVIISCHKGLTASRGAVGVGEGTTQAVVNSSLMILIVNFFLTFLLNFFFPLGTQL